MKILHTSDLHIGKKLMGRERYDEYRAVLEQLFVICKNEKIELALICGDVFDTYTPSAEAESIYFEGIKKISSVCAVAIISGNHDDALRLAAPSAFLNSGNVFISGTQKAIEPNKSDFHVKCVSSGLGFAVFENDKGERVHLNLLPYPNEARFKEGGSDESFPQKMSRWISVGESGKSIGVPNIFVSHIFVAGGKVSDGEREIDLGGARAVAKELLPECDYCALGHLHARQSLGGNIYYSGAPMQFTFDDFGEKSVNVFDIDINGVKNFKQVPVTAYRKLIRLQANGAGEGVELLKANEKHFVELTLHLDEPLTHSESYALHECENLVSLKCEVKAQAVADVQSRKNKSSYELFCEYYKSNYDAEPKKELVELFLSLTEEE